MKTAFPAPAAAEVDGEPNGAEAAGDIFDIPRDESSVASVASSEAASDRSVSWTVETLLCVGFGAACGVGVTTAAAAASVLSFLFFIFNLVGPVKVVMEALEVVSDFEPKPSFGEGCAFLRGLSAGPPGVASDLLEQGTGDGETAEDVEGFGLVAVISFEIISEMVAEEVCSKEVGGAIVTAAVVLALSG